LRAISHTSLAVSEEGQLVDPVRFLVRDRGDVAFDASPVADYFACVEATVRAATQADPGAFLLSLGGDHSVTTRGLVETLPVTAMDMVEISPPLDPTDATLFLGLQVIFETFAVLDRRRRFPGSTRAARPCRALRSGQQHMVVSPRAAPSRPLLVELSERGVAQSSSLTSRATSRLFFEGAPRCIRGL
jgi:hypothetical protein